MFFNKKDLLTAIEQLRKEHDKNHREVDKRLDSIEKVLVVQEANLQAHMKRSDSLEKIVNNMQEKEIQPLRRHVNMVEGALKFIGLLGLGVSILTGIFKLFGMI